MATAKAAPKKKSVAKKQAEQKPQTEFDMRAEFEGLGERLDIMIQQLDAIRTLMTPPKSKAKKSAN